MAPRVAGNSRNCLLKIEKAVEFLVSLAQPAYNYNNVDMNRYRYSNLTWLKIGINSQLKTSCNLKKIWIWEIWKVKTFKRFL